MPDNSEFTRLAELLISRQDHQQQQLDQLAANGEKLTTNLAKTDEILSVFGKVQVQLIDKLEEIHIEQVRFHNRVEVFIDHQIEFNQHLLGFNQRQEEFNQRQEDSNQRQEEFNQRQEEFNKRQDEFNKRQEEFNKRQEDSDQRQEEFNKRREEFNIIFLEEIRGMKNDIRTLRDVTLKQYDERIQRLEDFMNGFMRKAS